MKILKNNILMLKIFTECAPVYVVISFIYATMNAVIPVYNSLVIKNVIDSLSKEKTSINTILYYVTPFFIYSLALIIFSLWFSKYYELIILNNVVKKIQVKMFEIVKTIDLIDYDNSDYYDAYVKAIAEIDTRAKTVLDMIINIYSSVITIGTLFSFVVLLDQYIWVYNIIGVICYVIINILKNKIIFEFKQKSIFTYRFIDYIKRIFYLSPYAKQIKTTGIYKLSVEKYYEKMDEVLDLNMVAAKKHRQYDFVSNITTILLNAILMLYLAAEILNNQLTIGDFTVLFTACQLLTSHLSKMFYIIPDMQNNSLYIDNLRIFWNYKPSIDLPKDHSDEIINNERIDIKLENISFMFGDKEILKQINMRIKQGENVAIVGKNGAGKSTLIRILLRLYEPNKGKMFINDKNVKNYGLDNYRSNIVSVFQDHQMFAYSIAENILHHSVNTDEDEKKVLYALKKVDLYDKVINLPKGIYSYVTKEFDNDGVIFSGGEMQRFMLARVFISDAKVIIMDEPTSNLDSYGEFNVINNIFNEFKDKTIILICHKLILTKLVDNIFVISDGKIEEQGNFNELINKNGIFSEQYYVEANEYEKMNQY